MRMNWITMTNGKILYRYIKLLEFFYLIFQLIAVKLKQTCISNQGVSRLRLLDIKSLEWSFQINLFCVFVITFVTKQRLDSLMVVDRRRCFLTEAGTHCWWSLNYLNPFLDSSTHLKKKFWLLLFLFCCRSSCGRYYGKENHTTFPKQSLADFRFDLIHW